MTTPEARITSTANPRVKALAELRDRAGRAAAGRYLIEGTRELSRAVDAGVTFTGVVVAADRLDAAERALVDRLAAGGAERLDLGEAAFARVAYRQNPGAVLGVAVTPARDLGALRLGAEPLVLIVEGIEKPGNLGAMLRTADAAGADAVVVADPVVDAENPNVIRASQGAVFTVPLALASLDRVVEWATSVGLDLVAGSDRAPDRYWDVPLGDAVGVVVGREATGLSAAWTDAVRDVRIPMAGAADSLNAATAAALLLYEVVRRRSS